MQNGRFHGPDFKKFAIKFEPVSVFLLKIPPDLGLFLWEISVTTAFWVGCAYVVVSCLGRQFEHTILITEDGAEILTKTDYC